jgi:hypothetical protein
MSEFLSTAPLIAAVEIGRDRDDVVAVGARRLPHAQVRR